MMIVDLNHHSSLNTPFTDAIALLQKTQILFQQYFPPTNRFLLWQAMVSKIIYYPAPTRKLIQPHNGIHQAQSDYHHKSMSKMNVRVHV